MPIKRIDKLYQSVNKRVDKQIIPVDNLASDNYAKIIINVAFNKPSPMQYAKIWERASITNKEFCQSYIDKAYEIFTSMPEDSFYKGYIENIDEPDILISNIYHVIKLFYPLILLENEKYTEGDKYVIEDIDTLTYYLNNIVKKYSKYIYENELSETVKEFTNNIEENEYLKNKYKISLTRAQFAVFVLILTGMCEKDRIETVRRLKYYVYGVTSRKPTKIITHIVCCIVYALLQRHAIRPKHKKKGYCRKLTAEIINFVSPKNETGIPYSEVTSRSVEVALTGK